MEPRWVETIRRAQHREREAFEMLVEQHIAAVYRLAAAIVGPTDAQDVTQETFVVAWQQLPRLRDPEAFPTWLRRICVNRSKNWLRDARRRPAGSAFESEEWRGELTADATDDAEARAILEPAFERLTPDQRIVLALHYSLGYSIADAAAALGLPVGTVKSRLSAGLNALRRAAANSAEVPEVAS
jgi:RNA polymerase sigma-70 factor (ECF subfamily)